MRSDMVPGAAFPDYELSDYAAKRRKLSELQGQHPMVLVRSRGSYCPKDRREAEGLVQLHREMEVGYCRLVTISTDSITETNEYRSGVGAHWPFLSDPRRLVQKDLDIAEYTDPTHNPMIPHTIVLSVREDVRANSRRTGLACAAQRVWNARARPLLQPQHHFCVGAGWSRRRPRWWERPRRSCPYRSPRTVRMASAIRTAPCSLTQSSSPQPPRQPVGQRRPAHLSATSVSTDRGLEFGLGHGLEALRSALALPCVSWGFSYSTERWRRGRPSK